MSKRAKVDEFIKLRARTQKLLDDAAEEETQRQHAAQQAIETATICPTLVAASSNFLNASDIALAAKEQMKVASKAIKVAKVNIRATRNLEHAARKIFDTKITVVTTLQTAEQNRRSDLAQICGPLDWMSRFGLQWTRAGHMDKFCNRTLAALMLGLHVLGNKELTKHTTPFVDPEIIEEAIERSVMLYGASEFVQNGNSRWFTSANSMTGVFRVSSSPDREPDVVGVAWGAVKFGTKTVYSPVDRVRVTSFDDKQATCIGKYTGCLEVYATFDGVPYMQPHGDGTTIYTDGSVYTGNYAWGMRVGKGILCDDSGIIYTGDWNCNPEGQGRIRVAPGTFHQGSFINGISPFFLNDPPKPLFFRILHIPRSPVVGFIYDCPE